jgi:hypothetical protein
MGYELNTNENKSTGKRFPSTAATEGEELPEINIRQPVTEILIINL